MFLHLRIIRVHNTKTTEKVIVHTVLNTEKITKNVEELISIHVQQI